MQNNIVINSYENFILKVISDLNYYFFSTHYSKDIDRKETEIKFNDVFLNGLFGENIQAENSNNILIDEGFNKENYENYNSLKNKENDKKNKQLNEKYSYIKKCDKNIIGNKKNKDCKKIKFDEKESLKNDFNTNKKNSFIIKTIIDHKIIDILIFLALRHFSFNLQDTKINIKKNFEIFKTEYLDILENITDKELKIIQLNFYKEELEKSCGKILKALTDFLFNCVMSLANYEMVIIFLVKFIFISILLNIVFISFLNI